MFRVAASLLTCWLLAVDVSTCGTAAAAELIADPSAVAGKRVSFSNQIRPLFAKNCVSCHGGVRQLGGLSLIYREQALAECESGLTPIVPGSPDKSYLIERVSDPDPDSRMPPAEHGGALTAGEIELLTRWIAEGAAWEEHWAYVAPLAGEPPAVQQAPWPRDPLDRYVLARLEAEGLQPSSEAERSAWLRRVSLDLTGLPPTSEEYDALAQDDRGDAYEHVVDRLLASPHFGERWAAMWLDLARYADTKGYESDGHRDAWPFRDWVIRAFNDDMPFDEFTVKQLAGDLLPQPSLADRVATAFHRNTQTNSEGGTDDEEFRTSAVLDRVATTWEVWQGTTFRCAQCHDHPYDPIRNAEYYKFVAFFNTSRDEDVDADLPILKTPADPQTWADAAGLDDRIAAIRREIFDRAHDIDENASQWRPLRAAAAEATGQTKLVVRDADAPGISEVIAEGTLSANGEYSLEFPVPEGVEKFTALRIDALPQDMAAALKTAEMGFVLTRLTGEILSADGAEPQPVPFAAAFADEPEPIFDPQDSLRDNNYGWAEYTRMWRPRHAVFAVDKPVALRPGDRLKIKLGFHQTATGDIALCIRRGRFSMSTSSQWTDLLAGADMRRLQDELNAARERREAIPHVDLPVMAELPAAFARKSFTFVRGNWLDKDVEVQPGVPELFPSLPDGASADRLAMARWLVAPENPLTARVMVNRLWQELFGVGLVETAEDFGSSGAPPSHPELLDHLALRLQVDHRWSVKHLLRDIVLSATYRQSSAATPHQSAADPRNRLLGRGSRTRLSAEMIRDQALALSGRFTDKMSGPPVMPPQPDGVWRSVYSGAQWVTAEGDDRYRRAIYTYWKRTSGYPSMLTFDVPSRDVCVGRRIVTNTPLQALAVMNDPAFVELAQGLAERMETAAPDPSRQIVAAYRWACGRSISPEKLARLIKLYNGAAESFDANSNKASALAATRERYALVIVANALLNLDEILTK